MVRSLDPGANHITCAAGGCAAPACPLRSTSRPVGKGNVVGQHRGGRLGLATSAEASCEEPPITTTTTTPKQSAAQAGRRDGVYITSKGLWECSLPMHGLLYSRLDPLCPRSFDVALVLFFHNTRRVAREGTGPLGRFPRARYVWAARQARGFFGRNALPVGFRECCSPGRWIVNARGRSPRAQRATKHRSIWRSLDQASLCLFIDGAELSPCSRCLWSTSHTCSGTCPVLAS